MYVGIGPVCWVSVHLPSEVNYNWFYFKFVKDVFYFTLSLSEYLLLSIVGENSVYGSVIPGIFMMIWYNLSQAAFVVW